MLWKIGHGAGIFDKFLERGHYCWPREEFAKKVDLAAKLIVGNRLDESLGGSTRDGIELRDLRSG